MKAMPPDRGGRASRACAACRKQKTRCYESKHSGGTCLRCQRLRLSCSLQGELTDSPSLPQSDAANSSYDERLMQLERTVARLVERLEAGGSSSTSSQVPPAVNTVFSPALDHTPGAGHVATTSSARAKVGNHVPEDSTAPILFIRNVATEVGMVPHEVAGSPYDLSQDVILKGIINERDATSLLKLFQEHYGRWVGFKNVPTADLISEVKRSPLLLCACCLIAIRHTTEELASKLAPNLFEEAKSLFSKGLLDVPQKFDFFQASVILSMWSTTIGQVVLSIDSWLSSGFALQHALASDVFKPINHQENFRTTRIDMERLAVWNNLCLTHLHYSVGTKRVPLLKRDQIDKCRLILDTDHTTNFECRIVAEVNLYWIIHESCTGDSVELPSAQSALHNWKVEWGFLFDQSRSQFLLLGFHFAQLLAFDHSLKSRSAAVRESLLSEMVRLCRAVINLAMETTDDRTRHLSDHIYHVVTFAAVTLCRLLHLYEDQLSSSQEISRLDQLVLDLVSWLYSIGLPCHAAHTLGKVVAAFHRKLRPQAQRTSIQEETETWAQPEFANLFPDLLGMEIYDGANAWLPDWEPFALGPST